MYPEFVYTRGMQLILALVSCVDNFIFMYCISKLLLRMFGEKATLGQKALFAFCAGPVLQLVPAYTAYFIMSMQNPGKLAYLLMASPSPITALIYCMLAIKILKLPSSRSIELVGHAYLYFTMVNSIQRLISSMFFQQPGGPYNYMLDTQRHLLNLLIFLIIFFITWELLESKPFTFSAKTYVFANPKKDLIELLLKTTVIYLIVVLVPMAVEASLYANIMIFVLLLMLFISTLSVTVYRYVTADAKNKETHIYTLMKSNDEFRAIKHDFYNILQTYNGYFAIRDYEGCQRYHESLVAVTVQAGDALDLGRNMSDNPPIISLLIDKHAHAEQVDVQMETSLKCSVADLPIGEIDMSRVISCLLDNAIEAAQATEAKRVSFTIEQKTANSRLIIITNSGPETLDISQMFIEGKSTKEGHQGIGLSSVRKIIDKYGNCTFQMSHFNHEVTAYIELRN